MLQGTLKFHECCRALLNFTKLAEIILEIYLAHVHVILGSHLKFTVLDCIQKIKRWSNKIFENEDQG